MYRGQGWPGLDISRSGGPKLNVSRSDVARVRCIEIRGGQGYMYRDQGWPGFKEKNSPLARRKAWPRTRSREATLGTSNILLYNKHQGCLHFHIENFPTFLISLHLSGPSSRKSSPLTYHHLSSPLAILQI